jgi:hypothetical protein
MTAVSAWVQATAPSYPEKLSQSNPCELRVVRVRGDAIRTYTKTNPVRISRTRLSE